MTLQEAGLIAHLRWRLILVSAVVGALCSTLLFDSTRTPPVKLIDIRDADAVTFRGGRLEIYVKKEQHYTCDRRVDQGLRRYEVRNGKRELIIVPLQSPPKALVPPGLDHYINSLDIPENIGIGTWGYVLRATWSCPLTPWFLQPSPIETKDVPVVIEDPKTVSSARVVVEPPGPLTIIPVPVSK